MWKPAALRAFLRTCAHVTVLLIAGDFVASAAEAWSWLSCPIERVPVASSNLASVGYAAREKVLEIEFQSGGIYRYREVPRETYTGLMEAASKGQYFIQRIRGRFEFKRVKETSP